MQVLIALFLLSAPADVFDPGSGAFLDSTGNTDAVFAAADSLYRIGEYEGSAELYLSGLRARPGDGGAIYNLACCYGLLQRADLASLYLLRAWNAGFDDIAWAMGDPDFDRVREDEAFSSLVDSLSSVASTIQEAYGKESTFYAEAPFSCRVRVPENYDGSTPVPLLLGIHGYGGSAGLFMGLWDVVKDYGCIFACPNGPEAFLAGDRIGYSWYSGENPEDRHASAIASRNYVLSALDMLEDKYEISEVYLFGYSQGGGITYLVGLYAPERFSAIAPFSGWLDLSVITLPELREAAGLPVRIVHGEQDRTVEYGSAMQGDSVLKSLGYDVELFTFQGGHSFSREGLTSFLDEFLAGN